MPLKVYYRVVNRNVPFEAAYNCQILVSHPVEGVVSSQDGPCQWAESAWWNTPTMHEMRLEGSKKEGGGLVNMTKGLLARSVEVNERQERICLDVLEPRV